MAKSTLTIEEKKEIKILLKNLINSCGEGHSGEWNCSTDEGKEAFQPMQDDLLRIAELIDIDLEEFKLKII